ncbi:MAG: DUF2236 domain-containing protein [Alphaproteobacteria bacterium]|nr:DUF2236 domain-containing protein [Alphaproteobacteria bacterium]
MPAPLTRRIDAAALALMMPDDGPSVDFARPPGEASLAPPDSVSWRIFKNPVSVFMGGVAAVILELAEPSVRTGVWEHSSFRSDPVGRLRRTGLAAMVTVYGAGSVAERMIAGVVRRHETVSGATPGGAPYRANDPDLLAWVQSTASFGFASAYGRYVSPLARGELDRLYGEGRPAARLYGAARAPASEGERRDLFAAMEKRLEPSPIVFEFLGIMGRAPALPRPLGPLQRLLVRAAVELVPARLRALLGLAGRGLRPWEAPLVRRAALASERLMLPSSPAVQACRRMGLPADYLYRR